MGKSRTPRSWRSCRRRCDGSTWLSASTSSWQAMTSQLPTTSSWPPLRILKPMVRLISYIRCKNSWISASNRITVVGRFAIITKFDYTVDVILCSRYLLPLNLFRAVEHLGILLSSYPNVAAWFTRCKTAIPGFDAVDKDCKQVSKDFLAKKAAARK